MDLSQPKEGFVRKKTIKSEQEERTLIAKVYCEGVAENYQACLDATNFNYRICDQEKMQNYQCLHNALNFIQFEPISKAIATDYSECLFRYRNDPSFCTGHQSLLHPHLDSLFDRVYQSYRS